jgi:hypothetical protein
MSKPIIAQEQARAITAIEACINVMDESNPGRAVLKQVVAQQKSMGFVQYGDGENLYLGAEYEYTSVGNGTKYTYFVGVKGDQFCIGTVDEDVVTEIKDTRKAIKTFNKTFPSMAALLGSMAEVVSNTVQMLGENVGVKSKGATILPEDDEKEDRSDSGSEDEQRIRIRNPRSQQSVDTTLQLRTTDNRVGSAVHMTSSLLGDEQRGSSTLRMYSDRLNSSYLQDDLGGRNDEGDNFSVNEQNDQEEREKRSYVAPSKRESSKRPISSALNQQQGSRPSSSPSKPEAYQFNGERIDVYSYEKGVEVNVKQRGSQLIKTIVEKPQEKEDVRDSIVANAIVVAAAKNGLTPAQAIEIIEFSIEQRGFSNMRGDQSRINLANVFAVEVSKMPGGNSNLDFRAMAKFSADFQRETTKAGLKREDSKFEGKTDGLNSSDIPQGAIKRINDVIADGELNKNNVFPKRTVSEATDAIQEAAVKSNQSSYSR